MAVICQLSVSEMVTHRHTLRSIVEVRQHRDNRLMTAIIIAIHTNYVLMFRLPEVRLRVKPSLMDVLFDVFERLERCERATA